MEIQLSLIHWIYLFFVFLIMAIMIMRRDTSLACIIGIFLIGFTVNHSIPESIIGVFNSFVYAITSLLPTILIISVIVSMSKILTETGINEVMITPFAKIIHTPTMAYWVIGLVMMVISWFFWPSPAVALIGAVLIPVAIKAGLPALGGAMAMNLFGHGIALSSDFVIQGAPKLTADAAGIPVESVITASMPLVLIMGIVTTVTAFILIKRDMKNGSLVNEQIEDDSKDEEVIDIKGNISISWKRIFAISIPIIFIINVLIMNRLELRGGDATALIGGSAIFILLLISIKTHRGNSLEEITRYIIHGLQFGFKVFGPVIPIAAFFYLGDEGFISIFGNILPENSHGIVNDLGIALAHSVPLNEVLSVITLTIVGAITGLDGSGFSGISLAGSVAKLFSTALGSESATATLTALGQISGIWVGGGTLIPWALIPVAAICKVSPFDLARRNLIPVLVGLIVTTFSALFFL
ncbi:putative integral membrane protein [Desulfonispora thiosulfatigenes DSM 11270]|uniref:Putative integral membrane protein n=1 Tax=Desulfonispora thiosulfatigenes DSM 11270 TaxID=656914 RepID=A0A1W1VFC6_DESTI|nr:hypothetical protein [Desulfonispora thiosulfatigenes]SMB92078.1 putative integral membrane protein [Desulfonispora thiosulfatigenes DSM 11270]